MNNQLKLLLYLVFIFVIFYFLQDRFELFDISFTDGLSTAGILNTEEESVEVLEEEDEVVEKEYVEISRQAGGSIRVGVEIVDTEEDRALGLSNRRLLGDYDGMLFVFDNTTSQTFWMKDMYIDLDIVFIDAQKFIVDIKKDAQPCVESACPTIASSERYLYVLEVNSGFCDSNKVVVGDSISISK